MQKGVRSKLKVCFLVSGRQRRHEAYGTLFTARLPLHGSLYLTGLQGVLKAAAFSCTCHQSSNPCTLKFLDVGVSASSKPFVDSRSGPTGRVTPQIPTQRAPYPFNTEDGLNQKGPAYYDLSYIPYFVWATGLSGYMFNGLGLRVWGLGCGFKGRCP